MNTTTPDGPQERPESDSGTDSAGDQLESAEEATGPAEDQIGAPALDWERYRRLGQKWREAIRLCQSKGEEADTVTGAAIAEAIAEAVDLIDELRAAKARDEDE